MGGTLAMMIAARHPELVGRLMVVDMYPQPAGLFGGTAQSMSPLASIIASPGGRRLFANLMGVFSPPEVAGRSDPDVVGRAVHDLAVTDLTAELPRIRAPFTVAYAVSAPRGAGRGRPQLRPRLRRRPARPARPHRRQRPYGDARPAGAAPGGDPGISAALGRGRQLTTRLSTIQT